MNLFCEGLLVLPRVIRSLCRQVAIGDSGHKFTPLLARAGSGSSESLGWGVVHQSLSEPGQGETVFAIRGRDPCRKTMTPALHDWNHPWQHVAGI
jgi:hypothetical protein